MKSPIHVLLVDDFEDAREIYQTCLQSVGYRVSVAVDGAEALRLANTDLPHVVLMDLSMPGLSGTEIMRRMKADRRFDSVPIIAFTAHALEDERVRALADGFDAVISKPCLPDDLARYLGGMFERCARGESPLT